jgi:hypothetical protein
MARAQLKMQLALPAQLVFAAQKSQAIMLGWTT